MIRVSVHKYNSNNIKKSKMSLVYVYGSGECEQLGK